MRQAEDRDRPSRGSARRLVASEGRFFFFSSRRRHTRFDCDWSSDVCSSDLPLVLSVHSVVSWDFAMALVPGWHATIFAPYFVAGAIYSGCGMVITLLTPIRTLFGLEELITVKHFENLAKLCLLTGSIVGYAYACEYFMAWYSGNPTERAAFWYRAFGPYWWATWTMIICNGFLPLLLWVKKIRKIGRAHV